MMNSKTGRCVDVKTHLVQSLNDLLTTSFGSRVQREEYGSIVPDLLDQPLNGALRLQVMAGAIIAISNWEPRLVIKSLDFVVTDDLGGLINLVAEYRGESIEVNGIKI